MITFEQALAFAEKYQRSFPAAFAVFIASGAVVLAHEEGWTDPETVREWQLPALVGLVGSAIWSCFLLIMEVGAVLLKLSKWLRQRFRRGPRESPTDELRRVSPDERATLQLVKDNGGIHTFEVGSAEIRHAAKLERKGLLVRQEIHPDIGEDARMYGVPAAMREAIYAHLDAANAVSSEEAPASAPPSEVPPPPEAPPRSEVPPPSAAAIPPGYRETSAPAAGNVSSPRMNITLPRHGIALGVVVQAAGTEVQQLRFLRELASTSLGSTDGVDAHELLRKSAAPSSEQEMREMIASLTYLLRNAGARSVAEAFLAPAVGEKWTVVMKGQGVVHLRPRFREEPVGQRVSEQEKDFLLSTVSAEAISRNMWQMFASQMYHLLALARGKFEADELALYQRLNEILSSGAPVDFIHAEFESTKTKLEAMIICRFGSASTDPAPPADPAHSDKRTIGRAIPPGIRLR